MLVTLTSYGSDGRPADVTDPNGIVTQTTYDAANRKIEVIEDYATSGTHLNRTTQWTYTLDNQTATMTAVNATTGNQTTTWTYGTSYASYGVARADLLLYVDYPDSVSGSDRVQYNYNRLGQVREIIDQRGNVRFMLYDGLGRLTTDRVSTLGSGTDGAVRRIDYAYEVRGMLQTISSYDEPSAGSGTLLNEVQLTYNDFSQLITEEQDHSTSGELGPRYMSDTATIRVPQSSNEIRLNQLTYPDTTRVLAYELRNQRRNERLPEPRGHDQRHHQGTSTDLASYTYVGLGLGGPDSLYPHSKCLAGPLGRDRRHLQRP